MPKDSNINFVSIIKEVFDPVFREYGFLLQSKDVWDGRGEYVLTASKDDMELNFYLGISPLFYYCSVGIRLLGELAEKATPHSQYRSLDVSTIAQGLDPNFNPLLKGAQTDVEVRAMFQVAEENLLKYCSEILSGDVSSWSKIAEQLQKNWRK